MFIRNGFISEITQKIESFKLKTNDFIQNSKTKINDACFDSGDVCARGIS
jgi:hypothetical protein